MGLLDFHFFMKKLFGAHMTKQVVWNVASFRAIRLGNFLPIGLLLEAHYDFK
jgi:hypothetical protein